MGKRIEKINELIKRELAQILLKEFEFPKDILVTITKVKTTIDLREAKVFLSVLPENQRLNILKILNQKIYQLQQKINQRLRMRQIPKIKFQEERQVSQAARVEEILEKIKKEKLGKNEKR